jgi:hypothetical protein
MYEVTKTYHTGYLAGLTITSKSGVEMPVGNYRAIITNDLYTVTACVEVQA